MQIQFYKYQGTGNDFILIDNRKNILSLDSEQIKFMCNRKFGIGADGLILLELEPGADFKMVYFNSDGNQSSMCGNGGRCIVSFAKSLGVCKEKTFFLAADGLHEAMIDQNEMVSLKMSDVKEIEIANDFFYLNTGSPHYVKLVNDIENINVLSEGRAIRFSERFKEDGTNVNFIQKKDDQLFVRTYERGVENETLSCGTGVTAAALVATILGLSNNKNNCLVKTLGGNLEVSFEKVLEKNFYNIWLKGITVMVYKGEIMLP